VKYLKLAFFSLIFLFLFITGISLFMPSKVQVSKMLNTSASADRLRSIIGDFRTWEQWNSLLPGLASQNPEYSADSIKTKNITVTWKEKQPRLLVAMMERKKGKPLITGWKMQPDAASDSLTVQWYINIQLRWYPWEKFAGMLYEKSWGDKLSEGLMRLKAIAEKK
jgi:hypothetical protein